jgi:transcription elongation factor GreA
MRLQQLRKRLADLSLVNLAKIPRDAVGYGSRVTLLDTEKGGELGYQLVTAEESDVAQGLISTTSPIGRALLGKRQGDVVRVQTPAGNRTFEVIKLLTIYDD